MDPRNQHRKRPPRPRIARSRRECSGKEEGEELQKEERKKRERERDSESCPECLGWRGSRAGIGGGPWEGGIEIKNAIKD